MNFLNLSGSKALLGLYSLTSMRILITGGFGFIGGRLALHLSNNGHQIIISSRVKRDTPEWLPQAEIFQMDWGNETNLRDVCSGIDVVIHAAGMNSTDCQDNPDAALAFNGRSTEQLVRAAVSADVKAFIYLSTAHVYANPLIGRITEATKPDNPHSYATSHLAGENAVLRATLKGKTRGVVLRIANIYGTPTHADVNCWMLLVNDLCKQAVTTQEIILRSSGVQQRNFLTMSDVCVAIESLLVAGFGSETPPIINVGSEVSETINNMATLIQERCKKVLGFNPIIEYLPGKATNVVQTLNYGSLYPSIFAEKMQNNKNREIDSLLKFCHDAFAIKLN